MSAVNDEMSKEVADQYNAAFAEAAGGASQGDSAPDDVDADLASATPQESPQAQDEAAQASEKSEPAAQNDVQLAETGSDDDQKIEAPIEAKQADKTEPTDDEKVDAALELQRLKSWEGRLKKQAADQKVREEALDTELAERQARALARKDSESQEGSEAADRVVVSVADQVADGTLTVAQAMSQVSADFGDDFVKMIKVIVAAEAAEAGSKAVASVKGEVDDLARTFVSAAEQSHFERIEAAHPDFNAVRVDPAFAAFIEQADPDLQRIASKGSAKEVIGLIRTFKVAQQSAAKKAQAKAQAEPDGVDAAAGVRSGGLQLPSESASSDDYAGAFAEAAASAAKRN